MRERTTVSRWRLATADDWELGSEPRDQQLVPVIEAEIQSDLSSGRLHRIVHVVTVEHLAWSGIAVWAVITRFLELGMSPLAPYEARHALFENDLVNGTSWASVAGYHPAAGWVHLVEAGLFVTGGVSDFAARLLFAISGLLMILAVFGMRRDIGRAGAIAAAGLLTISPTFTYFSRTSSMAIVVAALTAIVIVAFTRLIRRPSFLRAMGLGMASGLLCAVGTTGLATAGILLVSLTPLGLYQYIVSVRPYLDLRIWLRRHASMLVAAMLLAGVVWLLSQLLVVTPTQIGKGMNFGLRFAARDYLNAARYFAPGLLLYEFSISLTAIMGVIILICRRTSSGLALFSLFWLIVSFAFFFSSHNRESDRLVLMLLPMVVVSALGIDYLHHTKGWAYARVVVLVLSAATVYIQILGNFIYPAPAGNEAPWWRHSNLYWRDGATTIEARAQLNRLRRRFPEQGGTVFNYGRWQPSLRWYLREFRPSRSVKMADLIIYANRPASPTDDSDSESSLSIDLEETWDPAIGTLNALRAIRFMFTGEAWMPLRTTTIGITLRTPSESAPTLILPPS
ncbi:MAG: hypothetical protein JO166_16480 [Deltaproteobacteria bacterium]|nr:hypothetical protein [Deltaproteobacteria bacterium]